MSSTTTEPTFERYRTWKRSITCLYDIIISYQLSSNIITLQYLNTIPYGHYSYQNIMLAGNNNKNKKSTSYLYYTKLKVPRISSNSYMDNKPSSLLYPFTEPPTDFAPLYHGAPGKLEITNEYTLSSNILSAYVHPNNDTLIAYRTESSPTIVYDTSSSVLHPLLSLNGHDKPNSSFTWSNNINICLSGGDDKNICLYDVNSIASYSKDKLKRQKILKTSNINPLKTFASNSEISCLAFSVFNPQTFASGEQNKKITLWDCREKRKHITLNGHRERVSCLTFSPHSENLLLSGGDDRSIAVWDIRKANVRLHCFEYHNDAITSVSWSPFSEHIFASSSNDRSVCLWDMTKIGEEQTIDIIEDGPTEMIFLHSGHTSPVVKVDWVKGEDWTCCSVSDNGILQFWKMNSSIAQNSDLLRTYPGDLE